MNQDVSYISKETANHKSDQAMCDVLGKYLADKASSGVLISPVLQTHVIVQTSSNVIV